MPKGLFFSILFWFSAINISAQNDCRAYFTEQQQQQLKDFQSTLTSSGFKKAGDIVYVPIQFVITATEKGFGRFRLEQLFTAVCELNERFKPVGFYFYLAGEVKYVNNDGLYQGTYNAIYSESSNYMNPGAVNVFFHGLNSEGWCGVYFGGIDVVFVLNRCQQSGGTTLTHELGHFFGLPHTFSGWEGGNIPSNIEKVDGSNCRNAGDGFCDTGPDYVSSRWGCNLPYELTDPNQVKFKPDSSFYMNYASDQCHTRFSNEQILAMQNNLNARNIKSQIPIDTTLTDVPILVQPKPNDSNITANNVNIEWTAVNNAWAYHVQVARFGVWEFALIDTLIVGSNSLVAQLQGSWNYKVRVKAIKKGNVCGNYSNEVSFNTLETNTGTINLLLEETINLYPNPVMAGNAITLKVSQSAIYKIFNASGILVKEGWVEPNLNHEIILNTAGLYILNVRVGNKNITSKIWVKG